MRFLSGRRGPPQTATPAEVRALGHVLWGPDPRFRMLVDQLQTAPAVRRRRDAPDRWLVEPESTTEDLMFPFDLTRVESDWVDVPELSSGRLLRFRAAVLRSGFLEGLVGRTADGGPWPDPWDVPAPAGDSTRTPVLVLPSLAEIEAVLQEARARLEAWLGIALTDRVRVHPPAAPALLGLRETDLGVRFSGQYGELVRICDGLDTKDGLRLLGQRDAYVLDPMPDAVVIAWDSDNDDDHVLVQAREGRDETIRRLDIHQEPLVPQVVAPDLRSFLRVRLSPSDR